MEQPKPDPVREEIAILQKQILELQKLQIDTKTKLEESNDTINALSAKVQTLENRRGIRPVPVSQLQSKATTTDRNTKQQSAKKKRVKKAKKNVRRQ
jgi:hypothetical protein